MKKILLIVILLVVLAGGYVLADYYSSIELPAENSYVGRESCLECHQTQVQLFTGSHHDKAMDVATEETVLGDFADAEIEHYGIVTRFFRDGEKFMVHTEGPTGEMEDFEVKFVFGVEPLQQYMVELDRGQAAEGELGRVQVLRVCWDVRKSKWFYLDPPDVHEKLEPGDPLHWTGITQCWNASCAECHSTDLKKNFEPLWKNYHTTFSEIDVSCEACHGPGDFHVKLAQNRGLFWDRKHGTGLNNLKPAKTQIDSCAPCHSRRIQIQDGFQPGCNFDDYYATQLITDQIYHADGQIRDEVYVYGSFIQSKMYHQGIKCSDCHDPHSAKLIHKGNAVCTSCHQHPAGKYDSMNHHHHQPGTAGSFCVDCHMPETVYMGIDPRRDHSFRVPRPDMSVASGTPNSCTGCHLDTSELPKVANRENPQYLDWLIESETGNKKVKAALLATDQAMADACAKWYASTDSPPKSEYYELMAEGLKSGEDTKLLELATKLSFPFMFRASAAQELAIRNTDNRVELAAQLLEDDSPLVVTSGLVLLDAELSELSERARYSEQQILQEFEPVAELVGQMLSHERLPVRIQAARVFANIPKPVTDRYASVEQQRAFEVAISEFRKSLLVGAERAINHARLGGLYEQLGRNDKAKDAYRTAIRVESGFVGPRSNLARLLEMEMAEFRSRMTGQGGQITAGELARLSEQAKRTAEEIYRLRAEEYELLKRDVEQAENLPGTHGLFYRFAMSSYLQGEMEAARKYLELAYEHQPENAMYILGLATFLHQVGENQRAASLAQKLIKLDPKNQGYQSLADEISKALKSAGQ